MSFVAFDTSLSMLCFFGDSYLLETQHHDAVGAGEIGILAAGEGFDEDRVAININHH